MCWIWRLNMKHLITLKVLNFSQWQQIWMSHIRIENTSEMKTLYMILSGLMRLIMVSIECVHFSTMRSTFTHVFFCDLCEIFIYFYNYYSTSNCIAFSTAHCSLYCGTCRTVIETLYIYGFRTVGSSGKSHALTFNGFVW